MPLNKVVAEKVANAANAVAKAAVKEANAVTKPVPASLSKVLHVSPALKKFLGAGETTRTDTMKQVWAYIKGHHLQDPANKTVILCDDKLKHILGKEKVKFTEIAGLLNSHFPKKGDKKP